MERRTPEVERKTHRRERETEWRVATSNKASPALILEGLGAGERFRKTSTDREKALSELEGFTLGIKTDESGLALGLGNQWLEGRCRLGTIEELTVDEEAGSAGDTVLGTQSHIRVDGCGSGFVSVGV